jgi:ATP-dependent DNA helicase RecG
LAPWPVDVLYGRLPPPQKAEVMQAFRSGATRVLLSTSVIEVGVDVANASVMLIQNAERFGLAQLHQLRGRIGRGAHAAFCILLAPTADPEATARLQALVRSNDGFAIAEADLQLRGVGDLLGREQSGWPAFHFGDLAADRDLVEAARDAAMKSAALQRRPASDLPR